MSYGDTCLLIKYYLGELALFIPMLNYIYVMSVGNIALSLIL